MQPAHVHGLASGLIDQKHGIREGYLAHRVSPGVSLLQKNRPDSQACAGEYASLFIRFLDTPERVVLEFTPEMSILFDGDKMAAGTAAAYAQFAAEDSAKG
jgi:hypothetical protein